MLSKPLTRALVQNCHPGLGQRRGGAYRATPSFSGRPMPYKAHEARRHKIPRARYKVRNWPEYDRALQQRGSLTVWVTPEALAAWHPPRTGQRGRPRDYSDVAIETGHLLRLAFGRPWRQTEDPTGAIGSALLSGRLTVLNHPRGSDHASPLPSTTRTRRYPP